MIRSLVRRTAFLSRSLYSTDSTSLPLLTSITPELRQKITGDSSSRKFRLESLKDHLLALDEHKFPLPECLSVKEWEMLLDLRSSMARSKFFFFKEDEKTPEFQELKKIDELWDSRMLTYDPKDIQDLSPEDDKKFRLMLLYRDSLREEGERVPSHINRSQIKSALKFKPGSRGLRNYLDFLASKEYSEHNVLIKKKVRQVLKPKMIAHIKEKREADTKKGKIIYGLGHNSLFFRFTNTYMDHQLNWRTIREFDPINGSPLVIDLSFLKTMNEKHARSFIKNELFYGLNWNKNARTPYAIHLTEFDPNCDNCIYLKEKFPHLFDSNSPVKITEKSYLDFFPAENLLYLSPDSKQDLTVFKGTDIPIIGAIVDPSGNEPLTLGKAKKQGIRHARLPMKKIIGLNAQLNVDHMVAIMCEWRNSRDWLSAFRFVPSRFFINRQKSSTVLQKSRTEKQMVAITRVFKLLSPKSASEPLLPASVYKAKMNELLGEEGLSSDDLTPWKTLFVPPNGKKVYNYIDYVEKKNYKMNNLVNRNKKLRLKDYFD